MWREATLLTDRAVQFATAKTCIFSDSVLCLGGSSYQPVKAWESKTKWYLETRYLKDLDRMAGEPMEFEWYNFPGFTTTRILDEIQKMMSESMCEPEQFKGRIIFMSIYNDIDWTKRGKKKIVLRMLSELLSMLEDSRKDTGRAANENLESIAIPTEFPTACPFFSD